MNTLKTRWMVVLLAAAAGGATAAHEATPNGCWPAVLGAAGVRVVGAPGPGSEAGPEAPEFQVRRLRLTSARPRDSFPAPIRGGFL